MIAASSTRASHSAVIPAKAGIYVDGRAQADPATTPKATAVWIPAFAGMTAEGVVADAALPHGDRAIGRRFTNSRAR